MNYTMVEYTIYCERIDSSFILLWNKLPFSQFVVKGNLGRFFNRILRKDFKFKGFKGYNFFYYWHDYFVYMVRGSLASVAT